MKTLIYLPSPEFLKIGDRYLKTIFKIHIWVLSTKHSKIAQSEHISVSIL